MVLELIPTLKPFHSSPVFHRYVHDHPVTRDTHSLPIMEASFATTLIQIYNLATYLSNATMKAQRTLNPTPTTQTVAPNAQQSNFKAARVVRGSFSSGGSRISNVSFGTEGQPGRWNFPLLACRGDLMLAECAEDECSGTDSSSLTSFFFWASKRVFGFFNPMRLRSVQRPAGSGDSDWRKWGLDWGSREGAGG